MKYEIKNKYITFIIDDRFHNKSLSDFFHDFHLSKKTIHLLKQNKDYKVNNRFVDINTILRKNDKLFIKAFDSNDYMYVPTNSSLDIRYEDDFILVVNKPSHLPIYPDDKSKINSLNHFVANYYFEMGYDLPVRPIHRLDNDTTGLVIYCKCSLIQPLLDYELSIKKIKRYYKAIIEGNISNYKEHMIKTYIGNDRHHNSKMRISNKGKEAITYYKLIKNIKNYALIECRLDTGRKHQIRLHMAYVNHPLVGDKLYNKESSLIDRQALHAYKIQLIHPILNEEIIVETELPNDFNFIER
jgi:23S rRNA pseudouridine1911/1915/1917 synthase